MFAEVVAVAWRIATTGLSSLDAKLYLQVLRFSLKAKGESQYRVRLLEGQVLLSGSRRGRRDKRVLKWAVWR
jgi:hypothetical protein